MMSTSSTHSMTHFGSSFFDHPLWYQHSEPAHLYTMVTSPESTASSSSTQEKVRQPRARGTLLGRGLACVRCRKRKQKCDGKQPECSSCTLVSEGCVYEKIERPKRQPRATAGEGLKAKLARLEAQYSQLLSGSASSSSRRDDGKRKSLPKRQRAHRRPAPQNSFDVEAPTHDPLLNAMLLEDMPAEDRNKVIHIFFTGSQRLGCPLIEKRFFERLASEDTSQQPHPALVHAMLLVGQAFTLWTPGYSTAQKHDLPTTTPSPKVLLAKTQAYLTDSLSNVDRMLDYLQASILLSYYFFQSGRLEEGQVISAANSGMTVVCKLNMVDQSVLDEMRPGNTPAAGHSFWDGSLLGRPADSYELGVRLWTFWQSWYYDAVFSLVSGTPLKRDPVLPTTVFPRPSSTFDSGLALGLSNTGFKELFENDPPQFPSNADEPEGASAPLATYLKGCAIMQRSNQYLAAVNAGTPMDDTDFTPETLQKLHLSLQCLLQEHLPVRTGDMFSNTPLSKAAACKIYCALAERIVGHIFIHTATLQLCRLSRAIVLSNSPHTQTQALASIRQIEINAARGAAQALKLFSEEVIKLDARMRGITGVVTSVVEEVQEHPCLMLGFLLTSVCMVLVDEIQELEDAPRTEANALAKATAEADLSRCLSAIERTAASFPLLSVQAKKIRDHRERRSEVALDRRQELAWEFERRAALLASRPSFR